MTTPLLATMFLGSTPEEIREHYKTSLGELINLAILQDMTRDGLAARAFLLGVEYSLALENLETKK
jgi:hypothetical protein